MMATAVRDPSETYGPQAAHASVDHVRQRVAEESERMNQFSGQAGRVAQPTTEQQRVLDERLKTLDMFQALSHGKFPNNEKIFEFLDKMIDSQTIEQRRMLMSEDGQQLLHDFRELLQTVKKTIQMKNGDELFQSLFYHLQNLNVPAMEQGK